jgi:hypothetical protein
MFRKIRNHTGTLFLLIVIVISASTSFAQQINIPIRVTDGVASDTMRFGLDPTATDGIDASLNEFELPPPPPTGIFDSRFVGDGIGIPIGQGTKKDYRNGSTSTSGVRVHRLKYQIGTGTTIRLSWANIPANISVRMQDIVVGFIIDTTFTGTGTYLITNPNGITSLKLTVTYISTPSVMNVKLIQDGLYLLSQNILSARDTCRVYLRQSVSPYSIVDSSKAIIDSNTFTGSFIFQNAPSGNYYLDVRHRNGLQTWSRTGGEVFVQGTTMSYDFTDEGSKAFGNNLKLKGTRYCIYSGDCNQDGFINEADKVQLVGKLGFEGYITEDINGNGFINASDRAVLVGNLGRSKITP